MRNANYMKGVARLLGVELNEKFNIVGATCNPHHITRNGLYDCENDIVDGLLMDILLGNAIIKKPILDTKERQYLANVIAPKSIYENVDYIKKEKDTLTDKCFIFVRLKNEECVCFPFFEEDKMYKGMKVDKEYTLEELGLNKGKQ